MRSRWRLAGIGAIVLLGGSLVLGALRGGNAKAAYETVPVDRGSILSVVGATGALEAVTTVQVGSQVSGNILSLHADFNTRVRRGELVARLDPSLFEARLGQVRANLAAARANAERARAELRDTEQRLRRARELATEALLPASELESAEAAAAAAAAQVKAAAAAVDQAAAAVHQAEVDLQHTVIAAPIDGVVVARNVDVGQTVAASLQAPTLFVIAEDLAHMQVKASIDEADIGRVREGQPVEFRVDAFPDELFRGRVRQVRLQPKVEQSVVTYDTIIDVGNPEQRLLPGMTATVSVIVDQRHDVLRVPAAALRFRPEEFEARAPRLSGRPDEPSPPAAGRVATEGRPALLFVLHDGRPDPVRVRTGAADGRYLEVREGLGEGDPVIVGALAAGTSALRPAASPSTSNPFSPQRQRRQR